MKSKSPELRRPAAPAEFPSRDVRVSDLASRLGEDPGKLIRRETIEYAALRKVQVSPTQLNWFVVHAAERLCALFSGPVDPSFRRAWRHNNQAFREFARAWVRLWVRRFVSDPTGYYCEHEDRKAV